MENILFLSNTFTGWIKGWFINKERKKIFLMFDIKEFISERFFFKSITNRNIFAIKKTIIILSKTWEKYYFWKTTFKFKD